MRLERSLMFSMNSICMYAAFEGESEGGFFFGGVQREKASEKG